MEMYLNKHKKVLLWPELKTSDDFSFNILYCLFLKNGTDRSLKLMLLACLHCEADRS